MSRRGFFLALAVLALGLTAGTPARAVAQDNWYASLSIENPTNVTLNYQLRWGDNAEWKNFSVPPNQLITHTYRYEQPNQNSSPRPYVRFDAGGNSFTRTYYLIANAAPNQDQRYSKRYTFTTKLAVDNKYYYDLVGK